MTVVELNLSSNSISSYGF